MAETEIIETTALARLEPQDLLKAAIEKGSDIATIERFVALAERVHAIQAKDAYLRAMAKFKGQCPPIVKSKLAKMPRYSYKFAPLGYIADLVDPVLAACGLSYRWTTPKIQAEKITVACIVSHELGHEESSGDLEMPIMGATQRNDGTGEGGANAMQRVGISLSYAERYSLMAVLGLSAEDDADGHGDEGGSGEGTTTEGQQPGQEQQPAGGRVITDAQGKRLWAIAREQLWSQDDVGELLKKHNLIATKQIPMSKYNDIVDTIKKEKKSPPASSQDKPTSEQSTLP